VRGVTNLPICAKVSTEKLLAFSTFFTRGV